MIIAALDFETTGTDRQRDQVIELGVSLYSTGQHRFLDSVGQLVRTDVPITAKITKITGIQTSAVGRFGYSQETAFATLLDFLGEADAVLGHNIRHFDWPMAEAWAKRMGAKLPELLVVDTFEDIYGVEPEKLVTMCANAGILLADAHSALADAQGSLKLGRYHGIDQVVERAKIPTVVVRSLAPRTDTNSENREAKFRWAPRPFGFWWKAVKETDVSELAASLPFQIAVLDKSIPLEQLRG